MFSSKLVDVYASSLRVSVAEPALEYGEAGAVRLLGGTVTRDFVRYWTQKARDPTFHSGLYFVCFTPLLLIVCCRRLFARRPPPFAARN